MSRIIVPFRDQGDGNRNAHLSQFQAHMLNNGFPDVYVIEQSQDGRRFNRGALLNAGHLVFGKSCDTLLLHDVDLLPSKSLLPLYHSSPPTGVALHLGRLWTGKYTFPTFFGGVVSIRSSDMLDANGFPNQCWGWGGEDDVFRSRLLHCGKNIASPSGIADAFQELPHPHQNVQGMKNPIRWENTRDYSTSLVDGITTLRFEIKEWKTDKHIVIQLQDSVHS